MMMASSCPGFICYAEKTHGEFILPYISTTKSPQQISGTIIKEFFLRSKDIQSSDALNYDNLEKIKDRKNIKTVYHTTIMPCYDKKLEASRDDFYNDILQTKDVDCVLATIEILDLLKEFQVDLTELETSPVDTLYLLICSFFMFAVNHKLIILFFQVYKLQFKRRAFLWKSW